MHGKKRKGRRRGNRAFEGDPDPEFQVAPMADLLFVLLVFFMSITSVEVLRTEKNLELPIAKNSKENKEKSHQVVVNVFWVPERKTGQIKIDGKVFDNPDAIVPLLSAELRLDPVLRVLVRADGSSQYSFISSVMKACSTAQISLVSFAVLDKSKAEPGKPVEN